MIELSFEVQADWNLTDFSEFLPRDHFPNWTKIWVLKQLGLNSVKYPKIPRGLLEKLEN